MSDIIQSLAKSSSYPLTTSSVGETVTQTVPGVFILGQSVEGSFHVKYVGWDAQDVASALKFQVGLFNRYKYEYAATPEEAFEKACILYHMFLPAKNKGHPERPAHSSAECPMCDTFEQQPVAARPGRMRQLLRGGAALLGA
jgi:hypothetical protein